MREWDGRARRDDAGLALLYIVLILQVLTVITAGVMLFTASDISGGARHLKSVQVFNVAEAGMNHAIARLQAGGAEAYGGQTLNITDGTNPLGTAVITVACLTGEALPCLPPYVGHRRVISQGTLATGGATRTLVAVVEGTPVEGLRGICAGSLFQLEQMATVFGDVGSNGTMDLQGSPVANASRVRNNPPYTYPSPYANNGQYTGSATAMSTITCASGCASHVAGAVSPNSPISVCPSITSPIYSPGGADKTVTSPAGWTMDSTTGYSWRNITVNAGTFAAGTCTVWNDFRIQTGAVAGVTTVVNIEHLYMGQCSRLVLLGAGNVDLRVARASAEGVEMQAHSRFGVLATDTWAVPAPVPAHRLKVSVNSDAASSGASAFDFDSAGIVAGTFYIPNGGFDSDGTSTMNIYGAVYARQVTLSQGATYTYDSRAQYLSTWTSFKKVKSWKDQ